MTKFKGTKGKWEVCNRHGSVLCENGYGIAQIHGVINEIDWEHNAQLISKAPEMLEQHIKDLELLEKVSNQLNELGGDLWDEVLERIALKKQLIQEATNI